MRKAPLQVKRTLTRLCRSWGVIRSSRLLAAAVATSTRGVSFLNNSVLLPSVPKLNACACRFPLGDTVLLSVGQASVYHVLGSARQPYDAEGPVEDVPRR